MLTIGTLFSVFQVEAIVGPEPGKQLVELSHRGFERKWSARGVGTKLPSRPFTTHATAPSAPRIRILPAA
jgi:hypothetical protein